MAKFCRYCGNEIGASASYCFKCGKSVKKQDTESTTYQRKSDKVMPISPQRKKPAKERGMFYKRLVAAFLALVLLFTAFVTPGFMRKEKKTFGDDENWGKEYYADNRAEEIQEDYIKYIPDIEAIEKLVPETVAVSPENHIQDVAGIHFDFDIWNLKGNDILEVRDAGVVETDDVSMRLLDFSLASGQHEFLTSVEVVIPKQPGEENATVEWFDTEQNRWRPVAYRESEDGKNFILRTDHFSIKAIVKSKDDGEHKSASQLSEQYLDITDGSKNFFSIKKVDDNGVKYPALLEPVQFERADAIRMLYHVQPEITSILRSNDVNAEAIYQTDESAAISKMATMMGYSDGENSIFGIRDKVLNKILGSSETTLGIGAYLWLWQAVNTIDTLSRELEKNDSAYPIIKKNLPSMIGSVSGGIGLLASAGVISASNLVVIPTTVVGIMTMAWPAIEYIAEETPHNLREEAYFYYMDNSSYLDSSFKFKNSKTDDKCIQLKMDGTGWEEAFTRILKKDKDNPEALEQDIARLYDEYIERFFKMSEDSRYSYVKSNFEEGEITGLFYGFYWQGYADEEDFQSEKSADMNHAKQILVENTKVYLFKVIHNLLDRWEENASEDMRNRVVPFLNQKLTFKVRDNSLESNQHFCDSVYAQNEKYSVPDVFGQQNPFSFPKEMENQYDPMKMPMLFADMHPEFIPANEDWSDYSAYHFLPHAVLNDDVVFECSRYFYCAMGSPVKMLFRGDGTSQYPEKTVDFSVPEREHNNKFYVYIDLKSDGEQDNKTSFSNTYVPGMDSSEYDDYIDELNSRSASMGGSAIAENLFSYAMGELTLKVKEDGSVSGSSSRQFNFNYLEKYPVSGTVSISVSGKGDLGENPNMPLTFEGSLSFYMPNYEQDFAATLTGTGTISEFSKNHGNLYYGADCEWTITASDWHKDSTDSYKYFNWKSE